MADDSSSKQERWQRTNKLLDSALAQPPETRAAFLAQVCGDNESQRRDVESLLLHHALAENFLEDSPGNVAADMFDIGQARLKEGQLVDHYKILSLLGVGGMGEVYLAHDTRLGRQVALKVLPAQITKDEVRAHRFEQEARAASALNHPNIVVIHQIGQVAEQLHIVTEFIDGQTLRLRLAGTPLRLAETLDIAVQVASALDAFTATSSRRTSCCGRMEW
jgi:eukaryotic-like serine/threonine-protein kinase